MKIDTVNSSLVAIKRLSSNLDEVEVTQAICEYCGKQIRGQALEVLNHEVSDICWRQVARDTQKNGAKVP